MTTINTASLSMLVISILTLISSVSISPEKSKKVNRLLNYTIILIAFFSIFIFNVIPWKEVLKLSVSEFLFTFDNFAVIFLLIQSFNIEQSVKSKVIDLSIVITLLFKSIIVFYGFDILKSNQFLHYIVSLLLLYQGIKELMKNKNSQGELENQNNKGNKNNMGKLLANVIVIDLLFSIDSMVIGSKISENKWSVIFVVILFMQIIRNLLKFLIKHQSKYLSVALAILTYAIGFYLIGWKLATLFSVVFYFYLKYSKVTC